MRLILAGARGRHRQQPPGESAIAVAEHTAARQAPQPCEASGGVQGAGPARPFAGGECVSSVAPGLGSPLCLGTPHAQRRGGESPDVRCPGEEGGAAQGGAETEYGLNALARWVAPGSAHPPLFQIPGPRPARRGRQDGGRSSLPRSALRQHLRPAARTHLEPPTSGERPQKRIPPQGCGSGAPGAPRKFFCGEPERSA
ncbi:hypothetical protein NDU88_002642 [Pleurodeles waltl]|uniref:Uncharacterized protein n=1 Tax=Pleurodeles waltl TaxID=8319 RepID=A0AAV7NFZ3_PLEWA|nr:hypothetical protein NDU88_002642 [Pleurodeles waltl]